MLDKIEMSENGHYFFKKGFSSRIFKKHFKDRSEEANLTASW